MRFADRFDRSKRTKSTPNQRIGFALFWLFVVAFAYFVSPDANFNTESHLYLAFALVDHHTVTIDAYHQRLGDESFVRGHYYTDKAPGLSFLATVPYAVLRTLQPRYRGQGYRAFSHMRYAIPRSTVYIRYAITYILVVVPSALAMVLFWLFLARRVCTRGWALAATIVYGLGTIAYVYSTWFFSHQICAVLLLCAFLLLLRTREEHQHGAAFIALAGLLCGFAAVCEYPTAVIGVALFVYALATLPHRAHTALAFVAGALPAAALSVGYSLAAFAKPFATGYAYVHSAQYQSHVHTGLLGLASPSSFGVQPPSLESLWQITFGTYRGLFVVSPVLVLGAAGFIAMWRRRDLRAELWLCLGIVALYFLMDAARGVDQNGWSGGWSVASRHLTPMLPFLMIPIACGLRNRPFRWAFVVLGGLSIVEMAAIVATGDQFSFADHNPLVHETLPRLAHGTILPSWGSLLGLTGIDSLAPMVTAVLLAGARIVWVLQADRRLPAMEPLAESVPAL